MFGPLNFRELKRENLQNSEQTACLLCDDVFNLKICFDVFLKHLLEVHCLIIEDVQNIYRLEKYISYWKDRFANTSFESIIPAVSIENSQQKFFLISDLIKEDKVLRHKLLLEKVLNVQEIQRTDANFKRQCLFCRHEHAGTRNEYVNHLSEQHNLQLGNPQNLVFIDELLDKLEGKLENLNCIYCEKTFPDKHILKEHMRKKIHKRINPQNKEYDKYYIVNYLDEKNTKSRKDVDDDLPVSRDQNSDSEYSDWQEGGQVINCLFCPHSEPDIEKLSDHMEMEHKFNFSRVSGELNFYQRVKLVNYIRKQVHDKICPLCGEEFDGSDEKLFVHLNKENLGELPEINKFDQPEFYFPTYENDAFLYFLEDLEQP